MAQRDDQANGARRTAAAIVAAFAGAMAAGSFHPATARLIGRQVPVKTAFTLPF